MKLFRKYTTIVLMGLALAGSVSLTSCSDDKDEFSTDQYTGDFRLNVWGPSPVARGGELRFLGVGMDKITGVTLPGAGKITDIKVISSTEIRITVPQSAEEGYIIIHGPEGDITSKTLLAFIEPISVDEITPNPVKPGETLTLKGEYLNKIHEVIFSENKVDADAVIPEDEFLTHSRTEISFVVPATAKTGGLILSDADPEMPNWIILDEDVTVIIPMVDNIQNLDTANPGDIVTVKGTNLDLVTAIVMANGEEIEFTYADGVIPFAIPDNACEGPVCLVTESGVEVVAATIGVCQPENLVATPSTELRPGTVVTLTGKNLQMIGSIALPTSGDPVYPEFTIVNNEKLTFTFLPLARSGEAILSLKGGGQVSIALTTAKSEVTTTDRLPAGAKVTINGKNLDLLASISFAGEIAPVTPVSETEATLTIPVTATSGMATLNMTNGENGRWMASIDAPTGAYIISGGNITGDRIATFNLGNASQLADVLVNGQKAQYILDGSTLMVYLPENYGKGTQITLVSADGSQIEYVYDFVNPNAGPEAIWEGSWENSGWGGNQDLAWGGYDWSTVKAGTVLTAVCTPLVGEGEWWCVSFRHGNNWGNLPGDVGAQIDTPEGGMASIVLSQEIIDDLVENGGLVITGDGYTLTKVTLE